MSAPSKPRLPTAAPDMQEVQPAPLAAAAPASASRATPQRPPGKPRMPLVATTAADGTLLCTGLLVISAREPMPRERTAENQPEARRKAIALRLRRRGAPTELVDPAGGPDALSLAVALGVLSADLLDFYRTAHGRWRADPHADSSFSSADTPSAAGLVPYFFTRTPAAASDPFERRLAWHATDGLTPILDDLPEVLADDAAVCVRAAELLCRGCDSVFAVTTHPGHHASAEHYGGYCFVNNAAFIARLLSRQGRCPFVVDVDYHAGDGSASLLDPAAFVSLHAAADYPYVPAGAAWAIEVPPGATWSVYEPLLRQGLRRRPAQADVIVLSLGFDTLADDPDARDGHRLSLSAADFGKLRAVVREVGLPLLAVQEGGYAMGQIPEAAEAFWLSAPAAAAAAAAAAAPTPTTTTTSPGPS